MHLLVDFSHSIASLPPDLDIVQHLFHPHFDWSLLAQQFETDVFANARSTFNNFVASGQLWALIVGVIIGYLLRGFTTYG